MSCIAEIPSLTAEPLWTRVRATFARAAAAIGAPAAIALLTSLRADLRRQIIAWLCPLEHVVRKLLLAEAAELHRAECARATRAVRIEYIRSRGTAQHWQTPRPSSHREEGREEGRTTGRAVESTRAPSRPLPLPPPPGAGDARSLAQLSSYDLQRPETWRAQFSFALPRDPHLVPNAHAPRIRALWGDPPATRPARERTPRPVTEEDAPFRLARRFEALRRVLENPRPHAERLARLMARAVRRFPEIVRRYLFAPARTNDYDPADARLGIDAMGCAFTAPEAFPDSS
jgi:hypothetical protein